MKIMIGNKMFDLSEYDVAKRLPCEKSILLEKIGYLKSKVIKFESLKELDEAWDKMDKKIKGHLSQIATRIKKY